MTRRDALIELRDKVKAGTIPASDLDAFVPVFGLTTQGNDAHMAYRGSLDAAKALHEAVLPGWVWGKNQHGIWVSKSINQVGYYGSSDNPARAWLLAILGALIAKETP